MTSAQVQHALRQDNYSHQVIDRLHAAMSEEVVLDAMRRHWSYPHQRDLEIVDCQLVRVYPQRDDEFVLEYQVRLTGKDGERTQQVFGELVGEHARERCSETLFSLRKSRRRQLRRSSPDDLVSCLPSLGLVLRLPGLDERLYGLKLIYDRAAAASILTSNTDRGGKRLDRIEAEILGHRLGKRCTARLRYTLVEPETEEKHQDSLVIKLYKARTNRGRQVFDAMRHLRERGFGEKSPIRIPTPVAYFDDWKALLMEDVHAAPLTELKGIDLVTGIAAAGLALAKLHSTPLAVSDRHTVDDEIGLLHRWVSLVVAVHPDLAPAATEGLVRVSKELEHCRHFTPTLVHRDFYEKQVLRDDHNTILIDFDTLCLSDPALDVGNFLAHLELNRLQGIVEVDGADLAFAEGYGNRQTTDFHARVTAYTRSALLRLACLYSFWPRWRHVVQPLLDATNGE